MRMQAGLAVAGTLGIVALTAAPAQADFVGGMPRDEYQDLTNSMTKAHIEDDICDCSGEKQGVTWYGDAGNANKIVGYRNPFETPGTFVWYRQNDAGEWHPYHGQFCDNDNCPQRDID